MKKQTPEIRTVLLPYRNREFDIEYFFRAGNKETILFLHGLGGAKENYWEACKSDALADHTLVCFDNPGTGNSSYDDDLLLNVDDLAAISAAFIDHLRLIDFILCGTSMGGLT